MEPTPKRRRRWIVHALGLGAGAVLAVATIAGASDSEAPPTEPSRSEPAWRKAKPVQPAIYSGSASDGSIVVMTRATRRWRWEVSSSETSRCHPKPNWMEAVDTYVVQSPWTGDRFGSDESNWRTSDIGGAPALAYTQVRLHARLVNGRVRGAFRRSDAFHTDGTLRFTCVHRGSFELTRAPALPD